MSFMSGKTQISRFEINNSRNGGKILSRVLFVVLALGAILTLLFIQGINSLPQTAMTEISKLTNAKIEAESVDFRLNGSAIIEKLIIRPEDQKDPILKANIVYARFGIGSLLLLRPRLKEININDFVFNTQYDLDKNQWNIASLKINVPENDAAVRLPFINLQKGTLRYSNVSKGRTSIITEIPIDVRFRPAKETLGGYSFDITTAEETDSTAQRGRPYRRNKLFGSWQRGKIVIAGDISSSGIPAFEKAWQINFLNGELNYDRNNNYSLKLKIQDLMYTKSTVKDTFIPDSPVFLTKLGLFRALQSFFRQYRPSGKADIELEASGNFKQLSESSLAGTVNCKDVSICDRKFPYTIDQISGPVDFTEKRVLLNNLSGRHGDIKITFEGWSKNFGTNPQYQIQLASDNMALDKDLYNALSEKQKELWSAFSPSGLAAIHYNFGRQSQTERSKTLTVELLDAEASYQGFAYPLKNLTGKVLFERDNIIVSNVISQVNEGIITFNGKVTECSTDRPIYYLSIKANNISFDSSLARRLLARQIDFYNQFDINGLADAEVSIFTPTEDLGPTSFIANLTLRKTSLKAKKSPFVLSDITAKGVLTPDSTSIKTLVGRYNQGLISLAGGVSLADENQPSHYHLTLNMKQAELNNALIDLLPANVGRFVSEWHPSGKIDINAHLNKAGSQQRPSYQVTVDCFNNSINYKHFAYPLRDMIGKLMITNDNVTLEDIVANPVDDFQITDKNATVRINGKVILADKAFDEANFRFAANNISFNEQLGKALPEGIRNLYKALSPSGRFDLDLDEIIISPRSNCRTTGDEPHLEDLFKAHKTIGAGQEAKDENFIDIAGSTKFKSCNFNISGTQAELDAILNVQGMYKTSDGFSNGHISLIADTLKIKGKSITNLNADINYNPDSQNWLSEDLIADFYGGRLTGKLNIERQADNASEYQLQVGFNNIDLRQFLSSPKTGETPEIDRTTGTMSGSLSIGGRINEGSSRTRSLQNRIGRCRLIINNMQVGKLSPLAKMLYVLKLKEQKDFAFGQMVIDSYIKNDKLLIEKFDLSGEAVAFYGSGWMDMPSENINLTLTARGERLAAAEPSIMQSLAEGLGRAVMRIEITGDVHDPHVETKTLPVIEDSLEILGKPHQ